MSERNPSLYEMLLQNFRGGVPLAQVAEDDQVVLSILDNLQRLLNARAGSLAHLPDYGLPDLSEILHGLPATAHQLMLALRATLLAYEPRIAGVDVQTLAAGQPGYLEYALQVQLKGGEQVTFATLVQPEGRMLLRHLRRQFGAEP